MTKPAAPLTCGLYPTIITPFFEDGAIDYQGVERLIAHFARAGCEGVFAVCQSSEMFFLMEEEKLDLAAFCLARCRRHGLVCVVSGHTQDSLEAQIGYLRKLEALGPDAIILVTNRLAAADEGDATLIANLRRVVGSLLSETRLGMYECPYPYKRNLTPAVIDAMMDDGRFAFVKDTSCDIEEITRRLAQMRGSGLRLYNANSATLYESVVRGAAGYSGVLLNFMPDIFRLMQGHFEASPPRLAMARTIADYASAASCVESRNYPANAKYYLHLLGIVDGTASRNNKKPLSGSEEAEVRAALRQGEQAYYRFAPHAPYSTLFEPGRYFRSCHASSVLALEGGTVLAVYFAGDHEKANNVGIWLSRGAGGCWHPPVRIAKVNETAHWNPVLMKTSQGVRVVFRVGREISAWQSYTMTSADQGLTWTAPVAYEQTEAVGPVRSKPIVLQNGWMLAPNSVETDSAWTVRVDVSFDEGARFEKLAGIPLNTARSWEANHLRGMGAIQPTLWESAPGHVHALLRTTAGHIFRADSPDSGRTWCEAYDTGLLNNNSGIDIIKADGALYLVMNPVGEDWGPRTPLVILRSEDNGKRFEHFATLADTLFDDEAGRMAEFSYPAIVSDGEALHCTFTHMRRTIAYARIPCGRDE